MARTYSRVSVEDEKRIYEFMIKAREKKVRGCARALGMKKSTVARVINKLVALYGEWWKSPVNHLVQNAVDELAKSHAMQVSAENGLQKMSKVLKQDFNEVLEEKNMWREKEDESQYIQKVTDVSSIPKDVDDVLRERNIDQDKYEVDYVNVTDDFESGKHRTFIKLVPRVGAPRESEIPVAVRTRIERNGFYQDEFNTLTRSTKVSVIVPDVHVGFRLIDGKVEPFHDRAALDIVFSVCADLQPNRIIQIGDLTDLPDFSRFEQLPEFQHFMQNTIYEANFIMSSLHSTSIGPDNDAYEGDVWIPGNHDKRWDKVMAEKFPQGYKINDYRGNQAMSLDHLLGLSDMGWFVEDQYPNGRAWVTPKLGLSHGEIVGANSGQTVAKMLSKSQVSVGQGHTHRMEQASETSFDYGGSNTIDAFNFGCLCRNGKYGPPSVSERNNWQTGFGVVYYDDDGDYQVTLVSIRNGKAIFEGKVYTGSEDRYVYHMDMATK